MPTRLKARMMRTRAAGRPTSTPKYTTMMVPMKTSRRRMNFPWVMRYVLQVS
jgi:hypothetical protein